MDDKTLDAANTNDAKAKAGDVEVIGNPDLWQLLCKASSKSQGWLKSTKAMEIPGVGCVVQMTTQQSSEIGGSTVGETSVFVPGVAIKEDANNGRRLIARGGLTG